MPNLEVLGSALECCCRMLNCPSSTSKLLKRCLDQVPVVVLVAISALLPQTILSD